MALQPPSLTLSYRMLANAGVRNEPPPIVVKALLEFGDETNEGGLVRAVSVAWFSVLNRISSDPSAIYDIDLRTWEELIAVAYARAGFDEFILTPRSGDRGRDVVATKRGVGSIRIFDQVKAYRCVIVTVPGSKLTSLQRSPHASPFRTPLSSRNV